jgi:hypothetical protein
MIKIFLQRSYALIVLAFVATLWTSCRDIENTTTEAPQSLSTDQYSATLAREWMDMAYNTVRRQRMFALDASRTYAYCAIAMHECMVHGISNGRSLAGQLQGLSNLPEPAPSRQYDWGIVLCHTMPQIMAEMIPNLSIESDYIIDEQARSQENRLRQRYDISETVVEDSKQYADELAEALIEWSRTDNRIGLENISYTAPTRVGNPQYYIPTDVGAPVFMMPFWWSNRPFVIPSYRFGTVPAPYPYSEDPNSAYYKDVQEVYDATLDPDKVAIGRFWANNPGQSGSPAGSWINIGGQLVEQFELDMPTTLRMYALLAMGTRDAFIACWYQKYRYNLQRPATFIREAMGHPTWASPVPTPPYPDYTSGTSTNAGVSSEILTEMFGLRPFTDGQHADKGFGVRQFQHFKQAGIEAYHSRIYAGVHMRRACEMGFRHGEEVGKYLISNLKFTRE